MDKLKQAIKENILLLSIKDEAKNILLSHLEKIISPNLSGLKYAKDIVYVLVYMKKGEDDLKSTIIKQTNELQILLLNHPDNTITPKMNDKITSEQVGIPPLIETPIEVVEEVSNEPKQYNKFGITQLQKYDVVRTNKINYGPNFIPHFAVVYKVIDDLVYCVSITSKEVYGKIKIEKSRMFKTSFFVPTFVVIPLEEALESFAFIFDHKKEFDNVVETIKKMF